MDYAEDSSEVHRFLLYMASVLTSPILLVPYLTLDHPHASKVTQNSLSVFILFISLHCLRMFTTGRLFRLWYSDRIPLKACQREFRNILQLVS